MSKRNEHPHHGGAWKVAYADFVTAMMALFIVLWILGTKNETKAAIASYFRNPSILPHEGQGFLTKQGMIELRQSLDQIHTEAAAESTATVESATEKLAKEGNGSAEDRGTLAQSAKTLEGVLNTSAVLKDLRGQVTIEFTSQGLRIQLEDLDAQPLFAVGSPEPTQRVSALLTAIAQVLKPLPNLILVEGHTDARPYHHSGDYTNWELSGDRANAARRILEAGGLDPARVARVVGYADRRLLVPDDPNSDHNRRISIIVCYKNATLDLSPGAAHITMWDAPEENVRVVREFLRQTDPPRRGERKSG